MVVSEYSDPPLALRLALCDMISVAVCNMTPSRALPAGDLRDVNADV